MIDSFGNPYNFTNSDDLTNLSLDAINATNLNVD
jgi:hypothetical protein